MSTQLPRGRLSSTCSIFYDPVVLAGRTELGRTGVRGAGPVFENAKNRQALVREARYEAGGALEQFNRSLPNERQRIEAQFQREEVPEARDFVTRFEALDRVVHSSGALFRLSW